MEVLFGIAVFALIAGRLAWTGERGIASLFLLRDGGGLRQVATGDLV